MVSFHNEVFLPDVPEGATHHGVMAALFLNTGFTDLSHPDKYFQSDWVWALPCSDLILDLDFDNAITGWDASGNPIHGPVANLGEVTSIGMLIGSNLYNGSNWGIENKTGFKVCIDTVPVPGAVLLGMLGLSVAGLKLRKYA